MSEAQGSTPARTRRWLLWIKRVGIGAIVIALSLQEFRIRRLEASVRLWQTRARGPTAGVTFPPLPTQTLSGEPRVVGARSAKTQIIAAFTTSCPYCRASVPEWRRLAALVDTSTAVDMVWLSLSSRDSTVAYVREHGLPSEKIAIDPEKALVLAARMRGVPVTLVVDTGGVIQHVALGQLTRQKADSLLLAARAPRVSAPRAPKRSAQP